MSFKYMPTQETNLYSENRTTEVDIFFIKILVDERSDGRWDNKGSNAHVLLTAQGWINAEFGKSYSFEEIDSRKRKLLKSYKTFKRIITYADVKWVSAINHVEADWTFWRKMFKVEKPLYKA